MSPSRINKTWVSNADNKAEQLALAEAGFVTVRVLQEFSRIGTKEVRPWAEHLSLTCCVEGGVNVTLGKRATG